MSETFHVRDFPRNEREVLRVTWAEFNGHTYLDLRTYYRSGESLKPTRKGQSIRPDMIPALIAALREAEAIGQANNLIPRAA